MIIADVQLLLQKTLEQLMLVSISVLLAIVIGVPLGIGLKHTPRLQRIMLGIASVLQTVPSLALLAALLPFFGIGVTPALIALTLYALLPILRNTVTALQQIAPVYIEAAQNLGASRWQCLWKIQLPLALPLIISGVRIAVASTAGIATIAAFIGAGGLGDFITRGLAMNNNHLLLMGAIPAAILALILDAVFASLENKPFRFIAFITITLFLTLGWLGFSAYAASHNDNNIRIGSKSFTEQYILGEIIAQLIEEKTTLHVERDFNLGTTEICQEAMQKGDIDIYPEYTGTAYMTVLHQNKLLSPNKTFDYVKKAYQQKYKITWLDPLGFNNSQSLTVRMDFAKQHHLKSISDLKALAPSLIMGAPPEFIDRPDGYLAIQHTYGIRFKAVKAMDPNLMYSAIHQNQVQIIDAFTTDGKIKAYQLVVLKDDKMAFPAYQASLLIRENILLKHPELLALLEKLSHTINDATMQNLNYAVDIEKKSPHQVAQDFLIKNRLI